MTNSTTNIHNAYMASQNINLTDLLDGVTPYEPALERRAIPIEDLMPEAEMVQAAANTAKDMLKRSGFTDIEVTEEDARQAAELFTTHIASKDNHMTPTMLEKPEVVLKLEQYVSAYDWKVVRHADQIRMLVTNKLLELSDHKDGRIQLKAVELLGKLADVGMFVEKQEVTYRSMSDAELQKKLQEKLGLLIEGEIIEPEKPKSAAPTMMPLIETPKISSGYIETLFKD